jgi:hypothetical protein
MSMRKIMDKIFVGTLKMILKVFSHEENIWKIIGEIFEYF